MASVLLKLILPKQFLYQSEFGSEPRSTHKNQSSRRKMKREGRQHGMVRTYRILPSPFNPRPKDRFINESDSPPTAGLFTKVPIEPTNHSKFTGKCGRPRCAGCRMHPVCKAKNKTKGTHKLRSCDVGVNCRLVSWRVVDSDPRSGLNIFDMSASGIVDHLWDNYGDGDEDDRYDHGDLQIENLEGTGVQSSVDGDDAMGFCHVEFVLDHVVEDDEDWCLVGEN